MMSPDHAAPDIYVLLLHDPYQDPGHPVPINATIVHALTLLHPAVPQPAGSLLYRQLVTFPGRIPGQVVPLSTLTSEVGGNLADYAGDWEGTVDAVVAVARSRDCDAMPLGLPPLQAALLAIGPQSTLHSYGPDTTSTPHGGHDRQAALDALTQHVHAIAAQAPFWPGDGLHAD